jgi:hypothetical protein
MATKLIKNTTPLYIRMATSIDRIENATHAIGVTVNTSEARDMMMENHQVMVDLVNAANGHHTDENGWLWA